jgi:uncharacterized protein YbaR (Trm112 family)
MILEARPNDHFAIGVLMIKQELLDILACPKCKTSVKPDEQGKYLICSQCKLKYPVTEQGIPIMLIDRAEPLDS